MNKIKGTVSENLTARKSFLIDGKTFGKHTLYEAVYRIERGKYPSFLHKVKRRICVHLKLFGIGYLAILIYLSLMLTVILMHTE